MMNESGCDDSVATQPSPMVERGCDQVNPDQIRTFCGAHRAFRKRCLGDNLDGLSRILRLSSARAASYRTCQQLLSGRWRSFTRPLIQAFFVERFRIIERDIDRIEVRSGPGGTLGAMPSMASSHLTARTPRTLMVGLYLEEAAGGRSLRGFRGLTSARWLRLSIFEPTANTLTGERKVCRL